MVSTTAIQKYEACPPAKDKIIIIIVDEDDDEVKELLPAYLDGDPKELALQIVIKVINTFIKPCFFHINSFLFV